MAQHKLTIEAESVETLRDWIGSVVCVAELRGKPDIRDGKFSVHVFVEDEELRRIQNRDNGNVRIVSTENYSERYTRLLSGDAAPVSDPSGGPPISNFSTPPQIKSWLDRAVQTGGARRAQVFQLTTTRQNNTSYFIRLGDPIDATKPTLLILGGVHGDELSPPEVLCRLPNDLLNSVVSGRDFKVGTFTFSAAELRTALYKINVIIAPLINPDGRWITIRSQGEVAWRKNGLNCNPPPQSADARAGVDINRNFDFLWEADQYFDPKVLDSRLIGFQPSDRTYRGPHKADEPETKSVVWLLDKNQSVKWLVDVHSNYGPVVTYNWGDDHDGTDSKHIQQFTKEQGKKEIGRGTPAYFEYVEKPDHDLMQHVCCTSADYANKILSPSDPNKRQWKALQSFSGVYPTCASTDDYAFSRHLTSNNRLPKVFGTTIEMGDDVQNNWANTTDRWWELEGAVTGFILEFSKQRW